MVPRFRVIIHQPPLNRNDPLNQRSPKADPANGLIIWELYAILVIHFNSILHDLAHLTLPGAFHLEVGDSFWNQRATRKSTAGTAQVQSLQDPLLLRPVT